MMVILKKYFFLYNINFKIKFKSVMAHVETFAAAAPKAAPIIHLGMIYFCSNET